MFSPRRRTALALIFASVGFDGCGGNQNGPNVSVAQVLPCHDVLHRLADSPRHIIPGHDPLVMARYHAVRRELEGIAVRLDVMPRE